MNTRLHVDGLPVWAGAGILSLLLWLPACTTTPKSPAWARTGDPLIDGQTAILEGDPADRVLWQYRTALHALRENQYPLAKRLLDDAIARIQNIYDTTPESKRARRMFSSESEKEFIGEPYERAMAFYYRGVLYWMDGELDNARACFRNAQFQDSSMDRSEYDGDYALMDYLDGYLTEKLGGNGVDDLARSQKNARLYKPSAYDLSHNVMFFVDFGTGPVKYKAGEYGEQLKFHEGNARAKQARVKIQPKTELIVRLWDNLSYQATTRGGRVMDHILGNKAVFKKNTDTAGNVGIIGGAVLAQNRDTQEIGLGLVAAGLLSKFVASQTTPDADTRMWNNLPQYIGFGSLSLPPGEYAAEIEFLSDQNQLLPSLTKTAYFNAPPDGSDAVIYVSDH